MIEVIIKNSETTMEKVFHIPVDSLKKDPKARTYFFNQVNIMIGSFLRDLREQAKEENK